MTPVIISSTGTIDPNQFISVQTVPQVDGSSRVFGFTAKGTVFELKNASNPKETTFCWTTVGSGPWIR